MYIFEAKKTTKDIITWISEFFIQNAPPNAPAIVGLSGGKDSTVVAALCAAALGADRVYGALLPQGEQKDIDFAYKAAKYLKIRHSVININDSVEAITSPISALGLEITRQLATNLPARIRMAAVYALSASLGGRVACTSNQSEDYVGYSTKFGIGTAGDFSPISSLTVTEVKAVGAELGLPNYLIEKVPEDGLSGKTDEDNLGFSYEVLDKYIREGICENEETKKTIERLHAANQHKNSPVPAFRLEWAVAK